MIDILVPALSRPQNVQPLVENIRSVTTVPHSIWFLLTPGDDSQAEAVSQSGAEGWEVDWAAAGGDFARKINLGFSRTHSEFVFMGADDLTFEPRWDTIALKAAGAVNDVVATNDLANAQVQRGEFGTHCLIRRRYITERGGTADGPPGQVLHEGYDHNFVDRELCGVAQHRGVYVYERHSRVRHRHPLWKTAPDDPTYRKALAKGAQDKQLFLSRAHLWHYEGLSAHERKLAA